VEPSDRTPDLLRKPRPADAAGEAPGDEPEVGEFRQGSPLSQWALARYLVGRAMSESVGVVLLVVAGVLIAAAVASQWLLHSTLASVFFVVLAVGVLLFRWVLLAVVRRLTGFAQYQPLEHRLRALVDDTRADVLRELRRVGLPGHTLTLPLLALRMRGRDRRADTLARLRKFELERAVPKNRLDEVHLLLRQGFRGGGPVGTGWQTANHDRAR
jgi:hypothetical protein